MRERQTISRDAFTLVEVLVVISVLGLLLAVLMPALAGARSQAQGLVCRSNLRQLALAALGYATENDGYHVPGAEDMWDNAGRHRWHGTRKRLDEPFDPNSGPLVGYLADGRIRECPTGTPSARQNDWNTNFEHGGGGYGYNMAYVGSRLWDDGLHGPDAFQRAYARTTSNQEITGPGRTLLFADTAMAGANDSLIEYSFAEPPFAVFGGRVMTDLWMSPSIHFRHDGQANVAWADGHVGAEPMAPLDRENVYGADSAALGLGWFDPVDNTPFDLR